MKPINPWPLITMLIMVLFLCLVQRIFDMNEVTKITTAKDWATDQEVRWCPGCGDYAVLKAVQRTMPDLGVAREKTVFISGIGCSSRFPYYMASYGFHTIHGRARAVATGVKLANPELDVWIITGDGDALSIGGNHTMHLLRRNLDCQILLFNNEIYGLTKGQYSPTSRIGTRSPVDPVRLGRPAGQPLRLRARLAARGSSPAASTCTRICPTCSRPPTPTRAPAFVEIFQNCVVYNDDVFAAFTAKRRRRRQAAVAEGRRADAVRRRHQGHRARPRSAGARRSSRLPTATGRPPASSSTIPRTARSRICWSKCRRSASRSRLGVIYEDPRADLRSAVIEQNAAAAAGKKPDLQALVAKGQTWMVDKEPRDRPDRGDAWCSIWSRPTGLRDRRLALLKPLRARLPPRARQG